MNGKKGGKKVQTGGKKGAKRAPLGHAPGKKGAKRGKKGASVDYSVTGNSLFYPYSSYITHDVSNKHLSTNGQQ